jgi:hypothetical protein
LKVRKKTPIFVGGTGRSGTTIAAQLLGTEPNISFPCHENKLIVEKDGILDLLTALSYRFDPIRHHFAISRFLKRANSMRAFGSSDREINTEISELQKSGLTFQETIATLQRKKPNTSITIHAIGTSFGLDHYDDTLQSFISKIISRVVPEGIVDTDGLLEPFFVSKQQTSGELVELAQNFVESMYSQDNSDFWVDDTPLNISHIPFLSKIFPTSKFIHMVRHPFDVGNSLIKQVWSIARTPQEALQLIELHHMNFEQSVLNIEQSNILEIKLEELIKKKDITIEKMSDFLGIKLRVDHSIIWEPNAVTEYPFDARWSKELDKLDYLSDWMSRKGYNMN